MKEKEFLKMWLNREIEDWGGTTSQEYKDFQRQYRSVLKEIGKNINFELHSFSKNHYEFSAVMKSNITNQFYYISISDVRYFRNEWANKILFRTMQYDKDWTGGSNKYSTLQNLSQNLSSLDKRILQELEQENTRQVINHIEPQKSNIEDFDVKYA